MTIGVWLLAVGVCDLLRAARDSTSGRRRALVVLVGLALLVFAGIALELPGRWWATVGMCWGLGLVAWVLTSSLALDRGTAHRPSWRALAFASFAVPLVLLTFVGDALPTSGLLDVQGGTLLGRLGPADVVLFTGVGLMQLSTSNILVRLLLDSVGVPASSNEKQLKGGRLLGPMERLFIVVLAVAGELTAAAVVVAAKGLLRFPELQRTHREEGPTDVSEYFLIGSFASWLMALGGWVLLQLVG
jgi:hypothetical protein